MSSTSMALKMSSTSTSTKNESQPPAVSWRLRHQLVLSFLAVHILMSSLAGWVQWSRADNQLREQASNSATGIAQVLGSGGIVPGPEMQQRLSSVSGYQVRVGSWQEPEDMQGWLRVELQSVVVFVQYQNEEFLSTTPGHNDGIVYICAGCLLFVLLSGLLARRISAPLERLAINARLIAAGADEALNLPPASAAREVVALSSELERMHQQLLTFAEQQRRNERLAAIGTFTTTIAHEVRNPLSAVRLTLQLLAKNMPTMRMCRWRYENWNGLIFMWMSCSLGHAVSRYSLGR